MERTPTKQVGILTNKKLKQCVSVWNLIRGKIHILYQEICRGLHKWSFRFIVAIYFSEFISQYPLGEDLLLF